MWKRTSFALALPLVASLAYSLFAEPAQLPGFPEVQQLCFGALIAIATGATVVGMRDDAVLYRRQKLAGLGISLALAVLLGVAWVHGDAFGRGGFVLLPVVVLGPYLMSRDRWSWLP